MCELGLQGAAKKRRVMRESQEMFESCWERRRRKKYDQLRAVCWARRCQPHHGGFAGSGRLRMASVVGVQIILGVLDGLLSLALIKELFASPK